MGDNPSLVFTIPNPPGKNELMRNVSDGERLRAHALGRKLKGRRRTRRYNIWRNAAAWAMRFEGNHSRTWETITGPVSVEIITGNPRQDNDAGVMAIFDLFTEQRVWLDDKQVCSHTVNRGAASDTTVIIVRETAQSRAA